MTHQMMTRQYQAAPAKERPATNSPFVVEFFMVQGHGFRCMAYRDQDGTWRNAFNHSELFGIIRLLE